MDEQLPVIQSVWDAEESASVSSRVRENPLRKSGRKVNKETFLQDAEGVYHSIGGFQRFVHEANEDPKWFFKQFLQPGMLMPNDKQEIDLTVHIHPALQRSALDGEYTDVTGNGRADNVQPGRAASESGGAGGPADPAGQDAGGRALTFGENPAAGGSSSHSESNASRSLIEAMRSS